MSNRSYRFASRRHFFSDGIEILSESLELGDNRSAICVYLTFASGRIFSATDFREWRASPDAYFRAR